VRRRRRTTVAAVHVLRAGTHLDGSLHRLYYGYASDLLLPLAMYFLPCLAGTRLRLLVDWRAKATTIFAAASTAEVLQGLGVPVLGRTFDPLDFVIYGAGVLAAVLLDRLVPRVLCRAPFAPSPPTA
jgi:hypothetical protein